MKNCKTSARTAAKQSSKSLLLFRQPCILAMLLLAAVFLSCNEKINTKQAADVQIKYTSRSCDIKVVDVDSCEYIVAQTGTLDGGLSIVHKQNCKYCAGRK